MSLRKSHIAGFLLASSMALGVAHAANGDEPGWRHGGHRGGAMMQLRGLDLTEAQRDQIFKIFHDQAPAMREQMKQMRNARRDLTRAVGGDPYDAARVQAAADAAGKATTQIALLRAQTMRRVREVLTPEQRAKVMERLQQHEHP